jgi:DNA helicase-2/ATP-dependent DNA helicase PcrA
MEVPAQLTENLAEEQSSPEVDLFLERRFARETVGRTAYVGKTYNSLEQIQQFFAARDLKQAEKTAGRKGSPAMRSPRIAPPPKSPRRKRSSMGSKVEHPRFGEGTVVRREGEGDEAKITVIFPGHGLKKLVQKYVVLKTEE